MQSFFMIIYGMFIFFRDLQLIFEKNLHFGDEYDIFLKLIITKI